MGGGGDAAALGSGPAPGGGGGGLEFRVDASAMDASLAYLVARVLPLCARYVRVSRFVERHSRYEYGCNPSDPLCCDQMLLREAEGCAHLGRLQCLAFQGGCIWNDGTQDCLNAGGSG